MKESFFNQTPISKALDGSVVPITSKNIPKNLHLLPDVRNIKPNFFNKFLLQKKSPYIERHLRGTQTIYTDAEKNIYIEVINNKEKQLFVSLLVKDILQAADVVTALNDKKELKFYSKFSKEYTMPTEDVKLNAIADSFFLATILGDSDHRMQQYDIYKKQFIPLNIFIDEDSYFLFDFDDADLFSTDENHEAQYKYMRHGIVDIETNARIFSITKKKIEKFIERYSDSAGKNLFFAQLRQSNMLDQNDKFNKNIDFLANKNYTPEFLYNNLLRRCRTTISYLDRKLSEFQNQ